MLFPTQRPPNRYPMRQNQRPTGFMMGPPRNIPNSRSSGTNLLQKVLGKGPQTTEIASRGAGGLSKTLSNVQQVLHVIQSTAPIIQEYGPMVKNLPAMYRMMKAFKELDDDEPSEDTEEVKEIESTDFEDDTEIENEDINQQEKPRKRTGQSTPKLFI
ncbi:VrrA/YqfQ family protein [Oceanobacillus halophilus]|uniref:YqfQ-like protein n=1 Tax=Oceanobacillus halophilus TaxID=930130 RepID=A0A495ACS7_9BACI|nr:VrrA/YqfQ family protein [Oceanobacillus halophilus]RKQ37613.1 hypothetical protein D8M06_02065 [Oceanobacillus halophilus]